MNEEYLINASFIRESYHLLPLNDLNAPSVLKGSLQSWRALTTEEIFWLPPTGLKVSVQACASYCEVRPPSSMSLTSKEMCIGLRPKSAVQCSAQEIHIYWGHTILSIFCSFKIHLLFYLGTHFFATIW